MKRMFIKLVALVFIFSTFNGTSQPISNGLIAYYPFNGNANDSSGYANHGMVYGVTLASDRFENPNSAYLFNGNSSYIEIPTSQTLESPGMTNQITQAAWVYLNGASLVGLSFSPVIMKTNSSVDMFMYRMGIGETGNLYSSFNTASNLYSSAYSFNLRQWYFIATTFNGSSIKLYVNGTAIGSFSANTTIATDSHSLTIGKDAQGASEFFNGIIDEVMIYNRALSDGEIQILYSGPTLPLNLTSFQVVQKMKLVELKWQTENEINTEKFSVERAINGSNFKEIGIVKSQNTMANSYVYNDNIENVESKQLFYRLKQVDKDGKFSYSTIVRVGLNKIVRADIFPNPITSTATIKLGSVYGERVNVKIANSEGKVILMKSWNLTAGNNLIPLSTLNLARGVYILTISGDNRNEHLTFSKQ